MKTKIMVQIAMSKSGDFSKSRSYEFFYDGATGTYRNPYDPSQGIDFLDDNGNHDELQWIIEPIDRMGRIRRCQFIGHPGGFEGVVKIVPVE